MPDDVTTADAVTPEAPVDASQTPTEPVVQETVPTTQQDGDTPKDETPEDIDPPVRESEQKVVDSKDAVIKRLQVTVEKLKSNAGNELTPGDEERIANQVLEKQLGKSVEQLRMEKTESEVSKFIAENPDFAPDAEKIKRYAMHPSRASVPPKSIAYEVAGDRLIQIGAERAEKARKEAESAKPAESTAKQDTGTPVDFSKMNAKQMREYERSQRIRP